MIFFFFFFLSVLWHFTRTWEHRFFFFLFFFNGKSEMHHFIFISWFAFMIRICNANQGGRGGGEGGVWRLSSADVGKALRVNKAHQASRPLWSRSFIWSLNWGGGGGGGCFGPHQDCICNTPSASFTLATGRRLLYRTILSVCSTAAASS